MQIANEVATTGMTPEVSDKLSNLVKVGPSKLPSLQIGMTGFKQNYDERKQRPIGMLTFVNEIDNKIGGLSEGTLNTIFAWTSQFKTTWVLNIAHKNSYDLGYNILYLSFEVSREDLQYNLLCRHSAEPKFADYSFIGHDKIRQCILKPEEESYIYDQVLPDLDQNSRGKLIILDESDFLSYKFPDLYSRI